MKKYHVTIDYATVKGNPATKTFTVMAISHNDALKYGEERVRKYKRFMKLNSGSAHTMNN